MSLLFFYTAQKHGTWLNTMPAGWTDSREDSWGKCFESYKKVGMIPVPDMITDRRWRWLRLENINNAKAYLPWKPEGRRKSGKTKTTWRRMVESEWRRLGFILWTQLKRWRKNVQGWESWRAPLHTPWGVKRTMVTPHDTPLPCITMNYILFIRNYIRNSSGVFSIFPSEDIDDVISCLCTVVRLSCQTSNVD